MKANFSNNKYIKLVEIAGRIQALFLEEGAAASEFNIFLCGGAKKQEGSVRESLRKAISGKTSKYAYRVYYPETLFMELLLGHRRRNLLELENLLAQSVSLVAIIVESAGSLVELGAFANHAALSRRLLVIVNEKYRTKSSFINMGPVRSLQRQSKDHVIYSNLGKDDISPLANVICERARVFERSNPPRKGLGNPISSYRFYLALVYVLEPIDMKDVIRICLRLGNGEIGIEDAATTAINSLISEGKIVISHSGMKVASSGRDFLLKTYITERKSLEIYLSLSTIRTSALNVLLRK